MYRPRDQNMGPGIDIQVALRAVGVLPLAGSMNGGCSWC